jgi:hypothetical protein
VSAITWPLRAGASGADRRSRHRRRSPRPHLRARRLLLGPGLRGAASTADEPAQVPAAHCTRAARLPAGHPLLVQQLGVHHRRARRRASGGPPEQQCASASRQLCGRLAIRPRETCFASPTHVEHRLLDAALAKAVTTSHVRAPGGGYGYGFGIGLGRPGDPPTTWHDGGAPGVAGEVDVNPARGYTVVVLENRDPDTLGRAVDLVLNALRIP